MNDLPFTSPEAAAEFAHCFDHALQQQGDCATSRELREMLSRALTHWSGAERKLNRIMELEVHGREFVDAAELYRILDKPIPEPVDHAANIRARAEERH